MSQNDFSNFYFSKSCHFSKSTLEWFWRAFWRSNDDTRRNFRAFQTSVQHRPFATFLFSFSVWFFEMELKPLLDLLNTGFTIIKNGLFSGGEHRKRKIVASIQIIDKMAMFIFNGATIASSCLVDVWKHFSYFLSSNNPLLIYDSICLPKPRDCWLILQQG